MQQHYVHFIQAPTLQLAPLGTTKMLVGTEAVDQRSKVLGVLIQEPMSRVGIQVQVRIRQHLVHEIAVLGREEQVLNTLSIQR